MLHLCPSSLGQCKGAGEGHVGGAVYIGNGFGPEGTHHTEHVALFLGWATISGVQLVAVLQCRERHSPVVEFGEVAPPLRIVEIGVFSRCHDELVPMLVGQCLTRRSEPIAPGDECDVLGIREEVVVGRRIYIVELAPENSPLTALAHCGEDAIKEGCHQLGGFCIVMFAHQLLTVRALCPVGWHGSLVASEVDIGRGKQGRQFGDDIGKHRIALGIGGTHHAIGSGAYGYGIGEKMGATQLGIGCEDGYGVPGDINFGNNLDVALGSISDDAAQVVLRIVLMAG